MSPLFDENYMRYCIENIVFPIFSIGMYLALCSVLSMRCKSFREWISKVFDFSDVDTLGYFLFRLFCTIYSLGLIPGVLTVFFFRWLFSLPIGKKGGKEQ